MNAPNITRDLELRHLPTIHQLNLSKILDVDDSVLSLLMSNIVKDLDNPSSQLRFNSTDIDDLREHSLRHGKSSILILFDEWSTMGKNRPKVKHLLDLLTKCQLYRAADFVSELLNEAHPIRPNTGPAARVNISLDESEESIENIIANLNYPFSSINLTKINRINYEKPAINTPNMNFVNEASLNGNNHDNQPTVTVASEQQISDLIIFSKSFSTHIPLVVEESRQDTTNSNSMAIPMTVNSSDNIESNFIPAISRLIESENNIPVFLQSNNISSQSQEQHQSDVPDFLDLMNNSNNYSTTTIEHTQSELSMNDSSQISHM
ncbi:hypothetical protein PVAND_000471 [Polypedilum vanderplanki]|uniref:Tube Death domain-containing protein n=1 Tax=Polypedilum vanderplanki TaxID=319348 RepID=A0A9J6BJX5_POLVA|nr:hypothetical protein PVAND_000471 [Polypedilum vanderplanki]